MKNLHTKSFVLVIFAVFAVCYCVVASRSGKSLTDLWSALVVAYKTVPLVVMVVGYFVGYAWRWKIFRGWLVPFPDLNGTWQGSIQTTWKNPETGVVPAPIPVILTIKQSFTRISCVMSATGISSFLAATQSSRLNRAAFPHSSTNTRDLNLINDCPCSRPETLELLQHPAG